MSTWGASHTHKEQSRQRENNGGGGGRRGEKRNEAATFCEEEKNIHIKQTHCLTIYIVSMAAWGVQKVETPTFNYSLAAVLYPGCNNLLYFRSVIICYQGK